MKIQCKSCHSKHSVWSFYFSDSTMLYGDKGHQDLPDAVGMQLLEGTWPAEGWAGNGLHLAGWTCPEPHTGWIAAELVLTAALREVSSLLAESIDFKTEAALLEITTPPLPPPPHPPTPHVSNFTFSP